MSYFHNVYLKRMNRDGKNRQERIKTRKEKEFDLLFLKKSMYQSLIYRVNDKEENILVSLQPNKWNESQLISNLLMSTSEPPLKTGDIVRIYQKIKDAVDDRIWLVLFKEENITNGHQTFKLICLDSEINITNEYGDTMYSVPVKVVNSSSSIVKDYFSYADGSYREPNKDIRLITHNFDFLEKDVYFEYNEKGYQIIGKNDTSVKDVAYVSVSERLLREVEPRSSEQIPVDEDINFFLQNS